jgi:predicted RNA-binding protein with PUA-like domain
MAYWLMKSEPDVFSINDLRRKKVAGWDGVRNYQARNNLRAMRRGDQALFYHSSVIPPAVAGLMEIVREAYPDPTAREPGWVQVDVRYLKTFAKPLTLEEIKHIPALKTMVLLKASRLSVQPVAPTEWTALMKILDS